MNKLIEYLNYLKWNTTDYFKNALISDKYNSPMIKEFLEDVFKYEFEHKDEKRKLLKVKSSGFSDVKSLENFDFSFQPNLNKNKIDYLATLEFIRNKENVVFIGTPGVGKTHLAKGIGKIAAESKHSVYYIDCNKLLHHLKEAKQKNVLNERLKQYSKYKLLIIDEMGFLPIDIEMSNMLFQLINRMYLKKSIIITTNKPFSEWGTMLGDDMIANAIIDRLVHKGHIISINGKSYRNYESLKSNWNNENEYK